MIFFLNHKGILTKSSIIDKPSFFAKIQVLIINHNSMSEFKRGHEEPRRPEAGDCPHGNKEAECPECLKDIEAITESLRKTRKPKSPEK